MRPLFAIYVSAMLSILLTPTYAWTAGSFNMKSTVHDIAVIDVKSTKTIVGQGFTTKINATVENQGTESETFDVTAYANMTTIETKTVFDLSSGTSTTVTFVWNTTGFAKGSYTISAYAWPVPGETDTGDNTFTDGTIKIGVPGDFNADGKCNILDLVKVAVKFGKQLGDPGYDPNYDINDDNKINILDLIKVARLFGTTDP